MAVERNDFIRDIIDADLAAKRHTRIATRFPPEPNGYLHIGHAKSIYLNFGIAQDYQGTFNLRYDDTNPTKEDVEYVEAIEHDIRWLGCTPTAVLFSADYFGTMYELAERLVTEGLAYVCDLSEEDTRLYRGTLSEPGRPSPNRDRTVAENLALLRKMKAGELPDGACTLRAKIDMASANMKMRDPLLYRIRHAHHHRSGDAWCIYPMYDWAHPLEDAIEGITHSICTLEFENNREVYDWVIDHTGPWPVRPHQYEFARLALEYTIMSKRKLLALVEGKHVSGWDDPRMPTIAGMRRRGYSPEALRAFADMIGVAKANSMVDIGKLEHCVRDDLNQNAPRVMGVLRPIEVELVGVEATTIDAPYFPADIDKPGSRPLPLSSTIFIDRDDWHDTPGKDYQRLGPQRTVRLRYGPCITAEEVTLRDGENQVLKLRARVEPDTLGGKNPATKKVSGVIHWVDGPSSVPAELRLYERLFKVARPEEGGGDFLQHLDPSSLIVIHGARLEASLANAQVGSRWQLERVGYFVVDAERMPAMVLNRIVSLRDTRAKVETVEIVERKENAKAKTRPKSKSPQEYRDEARVRDHELLAGYERALALGLTEEQADLLSGDRATAALFASATTHAKLAAKWIINELPRALDGKDLADVALAGFGEFVAMLSEGKLTPAAGKSVLARMVETGKRPAELATEGPAPADLEPAIDRVLAANPNKVAEYKGGKTGLLGFFVGQVMKASPNADAAAVNQAVKQRLG